MRKFLFSTILLSCLATYTVVAQTPTDELAPQRDDIDTLLTRARAHLIDLEIENAKEAVAKYTSAKKKAKKPVETYLINKQIANAENMLEHVEQLVIVDSISIPESELISAFHIPRSQGHLRLIGEEDMEETGGVPLAGFVNEQEDRFLSSAYGDDGKLLLTETLRLANGQWDEPDTLGISGAYPWMMTDGTTLYFADTDREDGLGGYDIYITSRDPSDGSFRDSRNLGMPINSAANDYMLAIDEENGIGWWATDRNSEPGFVTIYAYLLPEMRVNYNPELVEDIEALARIDNWQATWPEGEDFTELAEKLENIDPNAPVKKKEFSFPIGSGLFYYNLDDFPTDYSRRAMEEYLIADKALTEMQANLKGLREQYHTERHSDLAAQIRSLELDRDRQISVVRRLRSDVYKALSGR